MTPTQMSSPNSLLHCQPRWATPRRPERRSLGNEIAAIAKQLGQPLLPWQQLVADVGSEFDPETNLPAWREIICTVPRQSGKTTLVLAFEVQRAIRWATPQRIAYTAQTGWDARRKLIDDQAPLLMGSPLKVAVDRVLRGTGNESITFKGGSRIDVLASSESAGHGRTVDFAVIDEAFSDVDDRREQALLPAMATKAAAQLLVVSTMGTESSTYLNRKIEAGRASVANGNNSGIAYFEWSADESADIDDPATWWSCMPALGFTITEQTVRHARQTMSEGDFRRAMLNQKTISDERVIPVAIWGAVCSDAVSPDGDLKFGLDVNPERSAAAIVAGDGSGNAELVAFQPGVGWVVDRCVELARKWNATVGVDVYGPAGSFVDELESRGVRVQKYSGREMAYACGSFYDAVADCKVSIRQHQAFDTAVAGARRRPNGDSWTWARRDANSDVCPLVALTIALDRAGSVKSPEMWVSWE